MTANTIMLDFSIDENTIETDEQVIELATKFENILKQYLRNLKSVSTLEVNKDLFKLYISHGGVITNLRIYTNGLITITIEFQNDGNNTKPPLDFKESKKLDKDIVQFITGIKHNQAYVPIKRGTFQRYFPLTDDRIFEYDIDKKLFEERTQYQKVQIIHSMSLGNILILDDLQNISEADLIYTETLMCHGTEDYKGKEIVILGGGDGALLYELLKQQPKYINMLEIDEVVMQACAKYMRSICGNVLDQMKGPNYEIIVGDCIIKLNQFIKEGRKFDYVFGDLTDYPTTDEQNEEWNFINTSLEASLKILKSNGKFLTQVGGSVSKNTLKKYESLLSQLDPPVSYTSSEAFIPCYHEKWTFLQIGFAK